MSVFWIEYHNPPTFADGTRTRPSRSLGLRTYVLARFHSNASFDWVKRARSFLVKDELKYRDLTAAGFDLVLSRFPAPPANDLGKLVTREASTATIFLADSESYAQQIFRAKLNDGAEFARDFDLRDVINETAEQMIREIPLYRLRPHEMAEMIEPLLMDRLATTIRFDIPLHTGAEPLRILDQIGGTLRDAEVFTARAYSLLDFGDKTDAYGEPRVAPYSRTMIGRRLLQRALAVPMIFDKDHAPSVTVLNESLNALRKGDPLSVPSLEKLIREEDSRAVDALQAADIAAGFARETLDRKGLRALAAQFHRVVLNGIDLGRIDVLR